MTYSQTAGAYNYDDGYFTQWNSSVVEVMSSITEQVITEQRRDAGNEKRGKY